MPVPELARAAENLRYASFEVESGRRDFEDHSFSGVFFTIVGASTQPVDSIEIESVWVRGELGRVRVWYRKLDEDPSHSRKEALPADVTEQYGYYEENDSRLRGLLDESLWTPAYDGTHEESWNVFVEMRLEAPIVLENGERVQMYVHSAERSDRGLVYDDAKGILGRPRTDGTLSIYPGFAHLSHEPFGSAAPWYGEREGQITSLRRDRTFVGRLSYGVRWKLWCPEREIHARFPREFQAVVVEMLKGLKSPESALNTLDYDVLMYILNKFVGWDWFGTTIGEDESESSRLATSSGSKRVDVTLESIRKRFLSDLEKHKERHIHRPTSNVEHIETAVVMAKTIVSHSRDLTRGLEGCELHMRVRACVEIIKECWHQLVAPVLIPDKFPHIAPEKVANDMAIVQYVTDKLCLNLKARGDWHELQNPAEENERDELAEEDDEAHNGAFLKEFMETIKLNDICAFFDMSLKFEQYMQDRNPGDSDGEWYPADYEDGDSDEDDDDEEDDEDDDEDDEDDEDWVEGEDWEHGEDWDDGEDWEAAFISVNRRPGV